MPVKKAHLEVQYSEALKVLFILPPYLETPPPGYGGIENVAAALIPALASSANCQVSVISPMGSTVDCHEMFELTVPLYPIISNPYGQVSIPTQAYDVKVQLIAHSKKFDVIHDYTGIFSALASMGAAVLSDKNFPPIIHTIHGSYTSIFKTGADKVYNLMCQYPKINIHGISHAQIVEAPPHIRSRMTVVHNGIDVMQTNLGPGGDRMFVLGRVCYDKGQDRLVEFAVDAKMGLDIAGPVAELKSWDEIKWNEKNKTLASQKTPFKTFKTFDHLIDGDLIKFHGNVEGDNKAYLLEHAAVLVVPNRWKEPFGMVVVEAMACGTPVVACKLGAMPELIKNGVSGYCGEDWDDVTDYLRRKEYLKIDRAGVRDYVHKHFGIDNLAKEMRGYYERAIENGTTTDATPEKLVTGGFYMPTIEDLLSGNPINVDMGKSIEIWEHNAALIKPEDRKKFQAIRTRPDQSQHVETMDTLQARFNEIKENFVIEEHNLEVKPALKPGAIERLSQKVGFKAEAPRLDDSGNDPHRGHVKVKSIGALSGFDGASPMDRMLEQERVGCGDQGPGTGNEKVGTEGASVVTAILNKMDIAGL